MIGFIGMFPHLGHDHYDVIFYGDQIQTLVTNSPFVADAWLSEIEQIHRRRLNRLIVGLDIEWRPTFCRHFHNPVATLQLCVGRRCLVFQLLHAPFIPQSLYNFLSNANYTFVGVGINEDAEKLMEDYRLWVASIVDLRVLAAERLNMRELRTAGLKVLAMEVLGKEMEKNSEITTGRWDNPWLTPEQVQYACIDAFMSFEIGRNLYFGP